MGGGWPRWWWQGWGANGRVAPPGGKSHEGSHTDVEIHEPNGGCARYSESAGAGGMGAAELPSALGQK